MKNILIILVLSLLSITLHAQDKAPSTADLIAINKAHLAQSQSSLSLEQRAYNKAEKKFESSKDMLLNNFVAAFSDPNNKISNDFLWVKYSIDGLLLDALFLADKDVLYFLPMVEIIERVEMVSDGLAKQNNLPKA